jgi:hypothetical protein
MNIKNLSLISSISACLLLPVLAHAGSYEEAALEAKAALDNAKAMNYEWNNSRKLLQTADKLNKEGKTDQAMNVLAEAKHQGDMAVVQAKLQATVNGPR